MISLSSSWVAFTTSTFMPNLSTLFRDLLQKYTKYTCAESHKIKESVLNLTENTNYDTRKKTKFNTDALKGGQGAVLEQKTRNWCEQIAYASRNPNKAEKILHK